MAVKTRKITAKSKKKSGSNTSSKGKKIKLDPALVVLLKILGGCALLVYMFLSVYTEIAGVLGVVFKWLLAALFGDGLYYVPLISVYLFVIGVFFMKNRDGIGKLIAGGILMLFCAAGSHLMSDAYVDSLSMKNLGELVQNAQNSLNGGIFGTYLGEAFRALLGDIGATILVVLAILFCLFVMFNEIVSVAVTKLAAWCKTTFRQE
ncbi:MAG: hypothetical protein IJ367_03580, partial [Clostridia bacterium]|nr:hypothetical protein [Clostridia bacterium]